MAHSSRGLGHLPLKEEITGSNPVCATIFYNKGKTYMVIQTRVKHRRASLAGYASRGQRFPDITLCRVKKERGFKSPT